MIIVEDILEDIFKQIPDYEETGTNRKFPIRFGFGIQEDLTLFLTQEEQKYPLIWYVPSRLTDGVYNKRASQRLRLILAKNSENETSQNKQVWKTEFKECLNPLLEMVLMALGKSGATQIVNNGNYNIERIANFTELERGTRMREANKAVDYWNVIILDIDVMYFETPSSPMCINKINFPTWQKLRQKQS